MNSGEISKLSKKLNNPAKVQDFLNSIPANKEERGETCRSPWQTLRHMRAHCAEGALLAAAIFKFHGRKPLLLDLKSARGDFDHVVALFSERGFWGAVSKTNHAVLRYREPVYKTVRELAMSYFHEYFLDNGRKTLLSFSKPYNLNQWDDSWVTAEFDLWDIMDDLDRSPHTPIVPEGLRLRRADEIEIKAGLLKDW